MKPDSALRGTELQRGQNTEPYHVHVIRTYRERTTSGTEMFMGVSLKILHFQVNPRAYKMSPLSAKNGETNVPLSEY